MQLAPCLNGESYHALYLKIMEIKTPWYIQSLTETHRQPINVRKKRSLLKCSLKYCVECKKVWQLYWKGSRKRFVQYDNMPSYKITRKQCQKCKDK